MPNLKYIPTSQSRALVHLTYVGYTHSQSKPLIVPGCGAFFFLFTLLQLQVMSLTQTFFLKSSLPSPTPPLGFPPSVPAQSVSSFRQGPPLPRGGFSTMAVESLLSEVASLGPRVRVWALGAGITETQLWPTQVNRPF